MPLPIGFFMPLPLPIMIPFMMWQSAAIAAGFGTYFQFAKRRVSAMSNDEFNKADPHQLVNSMYEDIVKSIPSSFAKVDNLTPIMLQSMNTMLDQAVKWLQGAVTGNIFGTPNPFNPTTDDTGLPSALPDSFTPGESGQATIPSVAFLNSLNRTQLKAIRNDALRGDYTDSSKQLILARYKEVFEFDKGASIPDSFLPGIPFHTLDQNARNFQTAVVITAWPLIGKLRIAALKGAKGAKEVINMTNRWYGENRAALNKSKGPTAQKLFASTEAEILRLIGLRNKWLASGKSFTL